MPSSSHAAPTAGRTGTACSSSSDRHLGGERQLVEHGRHATARGVAHPAHAAAARVEQGVDRRPQRRRVAAHVGLDVEPTAGEHDRHAVVADRSGHDHHVARRRPTSAAEPWLAVEDADARSSSRRADRPCPARRPWCRRPRRPRRPRRAAAAIASASARTTSAATPSSRMKPAVTASGRAPDTARSLTVPLTASSPIDPPGKRIGVTTNASVVTASAVAADVDDGRRRRARRARRWRTPARTRPRRACGWPCRRRRGPS